MSGDGAARLSPAEGLEQGLMMAEAANGRGWPRTAGRSQEILSTFTRYVAERGYDGTNFSDIANELGISKGTIVHHYGTKDRLLAALHESYMRRRLAEARLIVERLDGPVEQLAGLLHAFIRYQVHDRDATVAFQREVIRLADPVFAGAGRQLRADYLQLFRDVISAGIHSGSFRPVEVPVTSLLIFGGSQWAWTWFRPDGREPVEQVAAVFVDYVLGSLLVRRDALPRLADPRGPVAGVAEQCLADCAHVSPDANQATRSAAGK
jgi:AcrR family transcriptional regulator